MTPCIEAKVGGPVQVQKTYPQMYMGMFNNKKRFVPLRRLVLAKVLGREPVQVGCVCHNRNCINPEHLFETTVSEVASTSMKAKWARQRGLLQ